MNQTIRTQPAPEVSFETLRPLIEKAATTLVTLDLKVSLPVDDWIDIARHAHADGLSIEKALMQFGPLNAVSLDVSSDMANALRAKGGLRMSQAKTEDAETSGPRRIDFEMAFDSWRELLLKANKKGKRLNAYLIELIERDLRNAKARAVNGVAAKPSARKRGPEVKPPGTRSRPTLPRARPPTL